MFKKTNQPTVLLQYINGQYYIERTIPVTIEQDSFVGGFRIIHLLSERGTCHSFRVNLLDKYASLDRTKGISGIILRKTID